MIFIRFFQHNSKVLDLTSEEEIKLVGMDKHELENRYEFILKRIEIFGLSGLQRKEQGW